jgi:hypothetical protein
MPLHKYKTFEEAEKALWALHPDVAYYRRVRAFFLLASRLLKRNHPPGVFKFRTFEEARERY